MKSNKPSNNPNFTKPRVKPETRKRLNLHALYRQYGLSLKYALRRNKPLFLARLFKNGCKLLTSKSPVLRTVDFAPTYTCNLRCAHCFAARFRQNSHRPKMTIDDYRQCTRQAMELGAVHFAFQGGEPLILDELEEIIRACQPERNLIAITTNTLLLTPKRIASLKKCGVDMFTISLDGGTPARHDTLRGKDGLFKQVLAAARNALAAGVNVTFNTVVSHDTLYDSGLIELIHLSKSLNTKLNLLYAVPIGNWAGKNGVVLTEADKRYLDRLFVCYHHLRRDLDANYRTYGCGAMKEVLYINCYGDVMPCPFIHASFGNVMHQSLASIWQSGLTLEMFRTYAPICLAAEDHDFIHQRLAVANSADRLPVAMDKMFPELNPVKKADT